MRPTSFFTATVALSVLMVANEVQSEVATRAEMELACRNWLSYVAHQRGAWAGVAEPKIAGSRDVVAGGDVIARCFSIAPRGFVLVPALKELPPIKAYSDRCNLEIGDDDGLAQLLQEVLEHRTNLFVKRYGSLDARQPRVNDAVFDRVHRQEWDRFLVPDPEFQRGLDSGTVAAMIEHGPLLTTAWHQGSPYNNFCPMGDGGRTVVGCVATAAAQVMNYHQWPPYGEGSHTYYWYGDRSCDGSTPGELLTADYSDTYDWANMPDDCSEGCSPAQEDALAELNYEVGVGFNMTYGACGSGAYTYFATSVLPTFFRYDPAIDREDRDGPQYVDDPEAWFSVIQTEIDAYRPMLYRISRHAIVCDGWRDTGGLNQYHMNYGWGGSSTAWYTVDNLHCTWSGCDPMVEYLIRNIRPALLDCNGNGIGDDQDIASQTSQDDNGNGIPDECECPAECDSPQPEVIADQVFPKNRYLSFEPGNAGRQAALRVKIADLPAPFESLEGETMWVGVPWEVTENSGHVAPESAPGWPTLTVATLQCDPHYADWGTYGMLHVYHQNIIPGGRYAVQAIDEVCDIVGDPNYSWPLTIQTSIWADVVEDCTTTPCGPPDGEVYITADVTMILDKFKNLAGAIAKARADIEPALPDLLINMTDVTWALDAFGGGDYPFSAAAPCP